MAAARSKHIVGLDLLRFFAAAFVMLFHLAFLPQFSAHGVPAFPELAPVASLGWSGVEIFFVLSGFVIANSANGAVPFAFARGRFLRIMPGVVICASATLLAALLARDEPVSALLAQYLRTLTIFANGTIDGSYWTLRIEVAFYGTVFLLLCLNQFKRVELFAALLGAASGAFWLWWVVASLLAGHFGGNEFPIQHSLLLEMTLMRHGCLFALGVTLWVISARGVSPARLAMTAAFLAASLAETASQALSRQESWHASGSVLTCMAVVAAGTAAIYGSVAWNAPLLAFAGRYAGAIRIAGLMTYPLYLLHDRIGVLLLRALSGAGLGRWPVFAAAAAICIFLSWVVVVLPEPRLKAAFGWLIAKLERRLPVGAIFRRSAPLGAAPAHHV